MKMEGTFYPDGGKVTETPRAGTVLEPQQVHAACHPAGGEDLLTGAESWREDPPVKGRGGSHPSALSLSQPQPSTTPAQRPESSELMRLPPGLRADGGRWRVDPETEYLSASLSITELPRGLSSQESAYRRRRHRFNSWVGKMPWRRKWQPAIVSLPGRSHGQRSLAGYSPQGRRVRHDLAHTHSVLGLLDVSSHIAQRRPLEESFRFHKRHPYPGAHSRCSYFLSRR